MRSVLLVGGLGTLTDTLYQKISRENVRVSVLTSSREPTHLQHVHRYSYDNDSVREVLDSCNPDTVVFLGAYDPSFIWTDRTENREYKDYTAGLTNLLHWSSVSGVKRFVYLSSECVFSAQHHLTPIPEETATAPGSLKGFAVALGESLVLNAAAWPDMDVTVMRLAQMYMIPRNGRECTDPFTRMCIQAVSEGTVSINTKIQRSGLHINDAVQALYLLLLAPQHQRRIYHVAGKGLIREEQAAGYIQEASARRIQIADRTVGLERCEMLADQYFGQEFDFAPRNELKVVIPRILRKMQGRIHLYLDPSQPSGAAREQSRGMRLLMRMAPYIEAVVAFVLVLAAEVLLADNSIFQHVSFFLLYVLLFALFHGLTLSIFAASLSVVGFYLKGLLANDALSLLMDVSTYIWIAETYIIGMSVGHLRNRLTMMQDDKDEEISYLSTRLGDISNINRSNVAIKNYFEQQTINSNESMGYFYDIVAQLDAANENEVLFVAVQLIAKAMSTDEVAVYTVGKSGFCRLLASTAGKARSLGKSIRLNDYEDMVAVLKKDHVFINRTMDDHLPHMCSAMTNDRGEIEALLFLWNLPYERMTLHYSNMLRILTLLIRSAVERTTRYLHALTSTRFWPETNVLHAEAFREVNKVYASAEAKHLTEHTVLRILLGEDEHPSHGQVMEEWARQASPRICRCFRQEDHVGFLEDGHFYVLLTNTSRQEAMYVIRRLENNGMGAQVVEHLPSPQ